MEALELQAIIATKVLASDLEGVSTQKLSSPKIRTEVIGALPLLSD
jgi:hypothetical protein